MLISLTHTHTHTHTHRSTHREAHTHIYLYKIQFFIKPGGTVKYIFYKKISFKK